MIAPPIPSNEQNRLDDLLEANLLDTPRETDFDNITDLASSIFGMPISVITLIDKDRQWFKSCLGLPENITETPREMSFCGHSINTPKEVTIIPDARKDERFIDNPLVTDGTIIFYAGAPLFSKNNNALGTLCIVDSKPRALSEQGIKTLKALANQVSKLVDLRLTNIQLDKNLQEKNTLLKEIHHRVKNNLQLISSLLNLQKNVLNDDKLSKAINTSQSRIKSMAIIHEKLYNSKSLSSINIKGYLNDLVKEISSNLLDSDNFKFNLEITDAEFDIEKIIPIGLIINELISNSIKHSKSDLTKINVRLIKDKSYILAYNDNGLGMGKQQTEKQGIGIELVESLVEQLEGSINCESNEIGLFYKIQFK